MLEAIFSFEKMLPINFLFCWLLIVVHVDALDGGVGSEICSEERCKPEGPDIRFPFRLKGSKQSIHCGYHGFDLSCYDNETVLEMPSSSNNLFVEKIKYASPEIEIYYTDDYPPREILNLSFSSSPLQFAPKTAMLFVRNLVFL